MNSLSSQYAKNIRTALDSIEASNNAALLNAAEVLYRTVVGGGVLFAFGTGHSQASALEVAGRAGGLIPTNKIAISDLVIYGNEPPSVLADPLLEREEGLAARLLALSDISSGDALIVFSNSGVNASVVEMARLAREQGIPVIAVTSKTSSAGAVSNHSSGQRLSDVADIVFDNLAPAGDASLELDQHTRICGVSSITAAYLVQLLVARVAELSRERSQEIPFYRSANVPGGHERNLLIEANYKSRLRRIAM